MGPRDQDRCRGRSGRRPRRHRGGHRRGRPEAREDPPDPRPHRPRGRGRGAARAARRHPDRRPARARAALARQSGATGRCLRHPGAQRDARPLARRRRYGHGRRPYVRGAALPGALAGFRGARQPAAALRADG